MPTYKCPECDERVTVAAAPPAGKKLVCPLCGTAFPPRDPLPDPKPKPKPKPTVTAVPPPPPPPPAPPIPMLPATAPPLPPPVLPDDDEDTTPYGVVQETDEEKRLAEATKPKYSEVKDKFKKSARGPAMALLVIPANLMLAEGILCVLAGIGFLVIGWWPILFSDSIPSAEEFADALSNMFTGGFGLIWGALIIIGAARMQNLGSYSWAVAGACIAILPLLAGVFALVALQDDRVRAGFREPESGPIGSEVDDEDDDDDDDEDDDD